MVLCRWEHRVGADVDHRVVPDGCADVIVTDGRVLAVGPADGPAVHGLAAGSILLGLRLRPEAVATFFDVPADELRNQELPLDDVVGTLRARRLTDTVVHGGPDPALVATPPPEVALAMRLLVDRSVEQCAEALGLSSRHLRRLLVRHSGLGPKDHQRVMRLRRFLVSEASLAQTALACGYADQPHLTREVTRLCGVGPARLRQERRSR
jgi:AraC-like DNA-binding protein